MRSSLTSAQRFRESAQRTPERNLSLSRTPEVEGLVVLARTITARYQRTDVKDRFAALRESLDADDQLLLILRVDRQLDWNDIARVFPEDGQGEPLAVAADPAAAELKRRSALLRNRFQLLKDRLRDEARRAGLLDPPGDDGVAS
jgi:RNA polymerase sigma-70 factor (ECF subfamily)